MTVTYADGGCVLLPEVLPDHQVLLERLMDEVVWSTHMKARQTASMGVPYNYGGASYPCLLYTSPSPRDVEESRMPSSA